MVGCFSVRAVGSPFVVLLFFDAGRGEATLRAPSALVLFVHFFQFLPFRFVHPLSFMPPLDIWQVRFLAASLPHFFIHRPGFRPSSAPGSAGLAVGAVRSTVWSSFCVLVALQFLSVCTNWITNFVLRLEHALNWWYCYEWLGDWLHPCCPFKWPPVRLHSS